MKWVKKYADIILGVLTGILLTIQGNGEIEKIQLYYSIIILFLVSIGFFKIIKQAREKAKEKRKENLLDNLIDSQKPVKALNLALDPLKEGEKIGKAFIKFKKGLGKIMKKVKEFFDKFKGYILTIALFILTVLEMSGGFINDLCGEVLTVNGVEILPIVTLGCTVVVGLISNGYTTEQSQKIKALLASTNKTKNELVIAEIKKTVKEDEAKLKEFNKALLKLEEELDSLNHALTAATNTHAAKVEMSNMTPKLATAEDVQKAATEVVNVQAQINDKKTEIEVINNKIKNLTTEIGALKSQL